MKPVYFTWPLEIATASLDVPPFSQTYHCMSGDAQCLHARSSAVRWESGERGLHTLWEKTGCHFPPLPGHLTCSWSGLIDQWLTKPYSAQVYTVFQAIMVRDHVDQECSWSSKQLPSSLPQVNRSPEIMMQIEQIFKSMARALRVFCMSPDTPVSLSELHSMWFSVTMRLHILVLLFNSITCDSSDTGTCYSPLYRPYRFEFVLLSVKSHLFFGCDHSGYTTNILLPKKSLGLMWITWSLTPIGEIYLPTNHSWELD